MPTTESSLLPEPRRAELRIEAVLQALADPVRLQIVRALATTPEGVACGEVPLPVTRSTRTHHLRSLREAGITSTRVEGTRRVITLRREDLDARYPGLLDALTADP